jgi:hypothetical protein
MSMKVRRSEACQVKDISNHSIKECVNYKGFPHEEYRSSNYAKISM